MMKATEMSPVPSQNCPDSGLLLKCTRLEGRSEVLHEESRSVFNTCHDMLPNTYHATHSKRWTCLWKSTLQSNEGLNVTYGGRCCKLRLSWPPSNWYYLTVSRASIITTLFPRMTCVQTYRLIRIEDIKQIILQIKLWFAQTGVRIDTQI